MGEQQRMVNDYGYAISQSVAAWAEWARKLLAEKSEVAARVIAMGARHEWLSDREIARRQVEESRAERLAIPEAGQENRTPGPPG